MFEYTGGGIEGGCGGAIVWRRFAAWLRQFSLWLCTTGSKTRVRKERVMMDIQAINLRRPQVGLHLPRGHTGYDNTACAIAISHT